MMNWGYSNMMGSFGILWSLTAIVVFIDLVLLGLWLWRQLQKK